VRGVETARDEVLNLWISKEFLLLGEVYKKKKIGGGNNEQQL
jgi:hypothetical protein